MSRIGAILLAAGSGSRMGRFKQLLPYRGKTLVEHAVEQAVAAGFDPIVAVLGASEELVRSKLAAYPVALVENKNWECGMGSSLAAGARYLEESGAGLDGIAVLLADQPLVTADHLGAMLRVFEDGDGRIVAAHYDETLGVPAIFPGSLLPTLEAMKPEAGARALLRDPSQNVRAFELPEGAADIDTPGDFLKLPQ
ncbi:MAG TPA: nucleotidyltransferase family protein [Bryobacteraceae bacterium]|nr:nucleotidyltransferase family protein [Bryobacteraceae bacterium]